MKKAPAAADAFMRLMKNGDKKPFCGALLPIPIIGQLPFGCDQLCNELLIQRRKGVILPVDEHIFIPASAIHTGTVHQRIPIRKLLRNG